MKFQQMKKSNVLRAEGPYTSGPIRYWRAKTFPSGIELYTRLYDEDGNDVYRYRLQHDGYLPFRRYK